MRTFTSIAVGARSHRRTAQVLAFGALLYPSAGMLHANADGALGEIGSSVESVLDAAHSLSPTLRAAALDTAAAAARADRADALDDPTLSATTMQVPGPRAGMDQTQIMIQQAVPLWGKLDLRKSRALALLDAARGQERSTAAQLDEKVRVAFAHYYLASRSLAINADVANIDSEMARAAAARLAQGTGTQTDAIGAQAEETKTGLEKLKFESDLHSAAAELNGLLARAPDAPLAVPLMLSALPASQPNMAALLASARKANPVLFATEAQVRSAEAEEELAHKEWYPDVTLGAGAQTNLGSWGYAASIGLKIPLQSGAHEAAEQEAAANRGAAEQRLAASTAEIDGEIGQAAASLSAAEQADVMRRGQLMPQLTAAYKSALTEYANGVGELTPVLEAVHRLHDTELELLQVDVQGQTALAMLERLIGGAL